VRRWDEKADEGIVSLGSSEAASPQAGIEVSVEA